MRISLHHTDFTITFAPMSPLEYGRDSAGPPMQPLSCFVIALTSLLVACGSGPQESSDVDMCGNGVLESRRDVATTAIASTVTTAPRIAALIPSFDVATNHCPELMQISILPATAAVSARISLSALAKDPDGRPGFLRLDRPGVAVEPRAELESRELPMWLSGRPLLTLWMFDTHGLRHDGARCRSAVNESCAAARSRRARVTFPRPARGRSQSLREAPAARAR